MTYGFPSEDFEFFDYYIKNILPYKGADGYQVY